jgi:hypothetical protein
MVSLDGGKTYNGNALRFATHKEAHDNAFDLGRRWMLVTNIGVEESEDPVNYRWVDGKLEGVK